MYSDILPCMAGVKSSCGGLCEGRDMFPKYNLFFLKKRELRGGGQGKGEEELLALSLKILIRSHFDIAF